MFTSAYACKWEDCTHMHMALMLKCVCHSDIIVYACITFDMICNSPSLALPIVRAGQKWPMIALYHILFHGNVSTAFCSDPSASPDYHKPHQQQDSCHYSSENQCTSTYHKHPWHMSRREQCCDEKYIYQEFSVMQSILHCL